jgi:hypothetical protein
VLGKSALVANPPTPKNKDKMNAKIEELKVIVDGEDIKLKPNKSGDVSASVSLKVGNEEFSETLSGSLPVKDVAQVNKLVVSKVGTGDQLREASDVEELAEDETLEALVSDATTRVKFDINGKKHIEKKAPYVASGNSGDNFYKLELGNGEHTISATPFMGDVAGETVSVKVKRGKIDVPDVDPGKVEEVLVGQPFVINVEDIGFSPENPEQKRHDWYLEDAVHPYMPGFVAAGVWDKEGSYTVKFNDNVVRKVNVVRDERKMVYLSEHGSDSNGTGSRDEPFKSLKKAIENIGGNTRYMLKRGERFVVKDSIRVESPNVSVEAYGSGDKPLIWHPDDGSGISIFEALADNFSAIGLEGSDERTSAGTRGGKMRFIRPFGQPYGKNALVRDCTFRHVTDVSNCEVQPSGFVMMDCDAPDHQGLVAYACWMDGTNIVLVGNNFVNSEMEHIFRGGMNGFKYVTIYGNKLENLDRRPEHGYKGDYPVEYDFAKACVAAQKGSYIWIEGNEMASGPVGIGPLSNKGWADDRMRKERLKHSVIRDNTFLRQSGILVGDGSIGFRIENNRLSEESDWGMQVRGWNEEYQRGVENGIIRNNTGSTIKVWGGHEDNVKIDEGQDLEFN